MQNFLEPRLFALVAFVKKQRLLNVCEKLKKPTKCILWYRLMWWAKGISWNSNSNIFGCKVKTVAFKTSFHQIPLWFFLFACGWIWFSTNQWGKGDKFYRNRPIFPIPWYQIASLEINEKLSQFPMVSKLSGVGTTLLHLVVWPFL